LLKKEERGRGVENRGPLAKEKENTFLRKTSRGKKMQRNFENLQKKKTKPRKGNSVYLNKHVNKEAKRHHSKHAGRDLH